MDSVEESMKPDGTKATLDDRVHPSHPRSRRPEMLTKTALKARGWTESLIRTFLSEPDLERRNPMYTSAAPMKLYYLWRVEGIEGTAPWKEKRLAA